MYLLFLDLEVASAIFIDFTFCTIQQQFGFEGNNITSPNINILKYLGWQAS